MTENKNLRKNLGVFEVFSIASFNPSIMHVMRSSGIDLFIATIMAFLYSVLLYSAVLVIDCAKFDFIIKSWS